MKKVMNKFFIGFLFSLPLLAQTGSGSPNCQQTYELTNRTTEQTDGVTVIAISGGTARIPQINNKNLLCNSWIMTTAVDGLSALSLSLQDGQNTYTVGGGTATSWANWEGTVVSGTNPTTAITSSTLTVTGYYPWVSINLASSTGTGSIYITLYGWKSPALIGLNAPTGTAGGNLAGTYPNPTFAIPIPQDVVIGSGNCFGVSTFSYLCSATDGIWTVTNNAKTGWTRINLGGTTSSFPAIRRNGNAVDIVLGDGSAETALTAGSLGSASFLNGATFQTATNCSSAASPAVCGSAAAGSVSLATGVNPTLQVNTSAVTVNSQRFVQVDDSVGTLLSVTCNSTLATITSVPAITARAGGASFTISFNGTVTTNPVCLSYYIVN